MDASEEFTRLLDTMRRLRAECPWDRAQTHASLRPYLLEEAYEVLDALDRGAVEDLREELGDLVLQVVFHAVIAEQAGEFTMADVLRGINEKLVRRHPHVFGSARASTPGEVARSWGRIKTLDENKSSYLGELPPTLPALLKAARALSKARQSGVDPLAGRDAVAEARRWLDVLERADEAPVRARAVGMACLALVEAARRAGTNAEDALRERLARFAAAFQALEASVRAEGRTPSELTDGELKRMGEELRRACEEG